MARIHLVTPQQKCGPIEAPLQEHPHQHQRCPLTKSNLRLLNKAQGEATVKSTHDNQALTAPTTSEESTSSYMSAKSKISTTNPDFRQMLYRNGVLNPHLSQPPGNLKDIEKELRITPESTPPTKEDYNHYVETIERAPNEETVAFEAAMILFRRFTDIGYRKSYDKAFIKFPYDKGFNNGLAHAQPDVVEGLDQCEFWPFLVDEQLGGSAVLYADTYATTLPHLAGEFKSVYSKLEAALPLVSYDGACMVYGRQKAREFLKSPDPPGHATVLTFATNGVEIAVFAHYCLISNGKEKYHLAKVASASLVRNYEDFKAGWALVQNAQDHAKKASENLRDELVKKWKSIHQDDKPDNVGKGKEVEGEMELDLGPEVETEMQGNEGAEGDEGLEVEEAEVQEKKGAEKRKHKDYDKPKDAGTSKRSRMK